MHRSFYAILEDSQPGIALGVWLARNSMPVFLSGARHVPAGPAPYHYGSVLEHLASCMNAVAGDPLAVWMALAHDAGKITTPRALWPHHYGHEIRGEVLAEIWAGQLGLDATYCSAGRMIARWHMRAGRYPILRPGKKASLLRMVQTSGFSDAFWKVVDSDTHSQLGQLARMHGCLLA